MKNLITFFLTTWILIQLLPGQTPNLIPNASFENWEADTLFHTWEGYTTTNTTSYFYTGTPTVSAVTAPFGQAARLETHIVGKDTAVGELVLGAFCPTGFLGGMAYSDRPDSLVAYVRYDVASPNHASIALLFKMGETPVTIRYLPINAAQPNYIRRAFALNMSAVPAYDQVAMVIASSDKSQATDGAWIEIDSIAFVGGTQQFVNPSFNDVSLLHYEDPIGWASPNISFGLFGNTTGISKSTDAYDGMYAVKIQTVDYISNCEADTFGFLGEGSWHVIDGQEGGQPFQLDGGQMKLSGYYKYEPVGNDTALAAILFTKYNPVTGERDTVQAMIEALAPSMNYQEFEIRFDSTDFIIQPDSFHLVFQASDNDQFASQAVRGAGSSLWIDGLEMMTTVGIKELATIPLRIYPNPASDFVQLEWEPQAGHTYGIQLVNMRGQRLLHSTARQGEIRLDIANLPAGLYFVILSDQQTKLQSSMKLVKK